MLNDRFLSLLFSVSMVTFIGYFWSLKNDCFVFFLQVGLFEMPNIQKPLRPKCMQRSDAERPAIVFTLQNETSGCHARRARGRNPAWSFFFLFLFWVVSSLSSFDDVAVCVSNALVHMECPCLCVCACVRMFVCVRLCVCNACCVRHDKCTLVCLRGPKLRSIRAELCNQRSEPVMFLTLVVMETQHADFLLHWLLSVCL